MTSHSNVPSTLLGCLVKSEDVLGANRIWTPQNDQQGIFLANQFTPGRNQLSVFGDDEFDLAVDKNHEVLNEFLERHGFPGKFEEFDEDTFGTASVMKVIVEWLTEGSEDTIEHNGTEFPAFRIDDGVSFRATADGKPVVVIKTKSDDVVYLIAHPEVADFDLNQKVLEIESSLTDGNFFMSGVIAPCVDLDLEADVEYLKNMRTVSDSGQSVTISQVFQMNRFKMNRFGAKAESAAGMAFTLECVQPSPYELNEPFLAWIRRPGFDLPVFSAFVDTDSWSDPGDDITS